MALLVLLENQISIKKLPVLLINNPGGRAITLSLQRFTTKCPVAMIILNGNNDIRQLSHVCRGPT